MFNTYLIPANTKRGNLILGIFRPFDLILFSIGVITTLIMLLIMPMSTTWQVIIVILPAAICGFLIIPIPNYHNVLTVIMECYSFLTNRRKYKWKGWCYNDGQENK